MERLTIVRRDLTPSGQIRNPIEEVLMAIEAVEINILLEARP